MTAQPLAPTDSSGFVLRDEDYDAVCRLLYEEAGISLGPTKRDMVRSRLAKRLRHHGLRSVGDYLRLVRDAGPTGAERQEFINCLTTNKTDFFRESHHFDYLRDVVVPRVRAKGRRLRVWSAACSTGEEPYTLAITLREACPAAEGWDVKILASDIDTAVLAHAERGEYDADRLGGVRQDLIPRYFLNGTGPKAGMVSVRRELRDLVTFRRINFMDDVWPVRTRFDVIFCRNVVIYFDRPTQQRLFTRMATHLEPDGNLVLGHSENLHWMGDTFAPAGPTVYRLKSAPPATPQGAARPVPVPVPAPRPAAPRLPEHSIILGEVKATRGPAVIKTLLGSCVSACIYDPETGVGGMNHFSLPGVSDEGTCARYGAHAMELLITEMMKKGADRSRMRAKVFGGAKVLNVDSEHLNVGAKNAAFVLQFLADEGIPVEARCLGGTRGLLVRFNPHTGKAGVKPLAEREMTEVTRTEVGYGRDLRQRAETPPDDGITLF